jgi:hypothetical protein
LPLHVYFANSESRTPFIQTKLLLKIRFAILAALLSNLAFAAPIPTDSTFTVPISDTVYTVAEGDDSWSIAATLIAEEEVLRDTKELRWAIIEKIKDLNEID